MIQSLKAFLARRRFQRAFASELKKVASERARHAHVRQAEAELQARVHQVLREGGSA
jgi:hypothetical protein